jgi:RNA polymerase sigma factor (sigma-70 family)
VENLITLLQKGDQRALEHVYELYRKPFLEFARKYLKDTELIEDTYQDAVLALYENALKGKFKEMNSSIKTYLFAIGKYMIFKHLRKSNQQISLTVELPEDLEWESYDDESMQEQVILLEKYLEKLGEKCRQIIELSYYQQKSPEEITEFLQYPNKETLKSQKSRCLQHLKKMFQVHGKS